jgi:mRNA interferase MazF
MRRGEVWWASLPAPWERRPVLLLARDDAYNVLTWVMVAPLTTTHRAIPTAVTLTPDDDGVPRICTAALDHIQSIRKGWLDDYITTLSADRMRDVDEAIHFALDLSY